MRNYQRTQGFAGGTVAGMVTIILTWYMSEYRAVVIPEHVAQAITGIFTVIGALIGSYLGERKSRSYNYTGGPK